MGYVYIEQERQRKVREIYESGIEVSRQRKKGYQAIYSEFVKDTMDSKFSKICNGAADISYDNNPIVHFLWDTVAPIINSCSDKMNHFLKKIGVNYAEVSPLLQTFQNPDNSLKVYKYDVPQPLLCNVRNGIGTDGVNEGNNDSETEPEK